MYKISYKLKGVPKLVDLFTKKNKQILRGMRDGVNYGSVLVEARAKEIVPVRTGNLMRSIHTQFKDYGLRALVGPDIKAAPYAYYVEFGNSKSGKEPPYTFGGRYYMTQAYFDTKSNVKRILEKAVKRELNS